MTREEIIFILNNGQKELNAHHAVKSLALFGSIARNESKPDNDLWRLGIGLKELAIFWVVSKKA
jgi:predicted nucleotidyltransferase